MTDTMFKPRNFVLGIVIVCLVGLIGAGVFFPPLSAHAAARATSPDDVTLSAPSSHVGRGITTIYAYFNWKCGTGASCTGESMDYNDVFAVAFSKNVRIISSFLTVSETSSYSPPPYINPQTKTQLGVAYAAKANFWLSGQLVVTVKGGLPACTDVQSTYAHGWSSNDYSSTSFSIGAPATINTTVTFTNTAHSWQANSPTALAQSGC